MNAVWVCRWNHEHAYWQNRGFRVNCETCGTSTILPRWPGAYWCDEHKPDWLKRGEYTSVAHRAVAKAIRRGELPHPRTLKCVDCSAPAEEYEHRDYEKPLEVEPVCLPCNRKRGPGRPYTHLTRIPRRMASGAVARIQERK